MDEVYEIRDLGCTTKIDGSLVDYPSSMSPRATEIVGRFFQFAGRSFRESTFEAILGFFFLCTIVNPDKSRESGRTSEVGELDLGMIFLLLLPDEDAIATGSEDLEVDWFGFVLVYWRKSHLLTILRQTNVIFTSM
ncbi:hypothetical protein AVEN_83919-1 [Araneus ventricosus]|uniref:Uncharacterized protein n=1 Tax=Araneus ventricosus TaxID=182803 RepID=A0A4Y2HPT3_ARAVE|nr:hypothetical protein AVEN_83919-1 [Araneus ventricosus]